MAATEKSSRTSRATPTIRLSGQRFAESALAAVRSAAARPAAAPLAPAGGELAGLS